MTLPTSGLRIYATGKGGSMATMTVRQVIRKLKELNSKGDFKMYLSSDEEGNSYHNIAQGLSFAVVDETKSIILFPMGRVDDKEVY